MATSAREAAILELIHDSDAIADTIQIVRERHRGDHAVVAATFRRRGSERLVRGFVGLRRFNDSGWRAAEQRPVTCPVTPLSAHSCLSCR